MDSLEFIKKIKIVVRDGAINDVISVTENPPGRRVSQLKARSEWYLSLPDEQKAIVKSIVSDSVDSALFGFLCVIDGVRAVENGPDKGKLELLYSKEESVQLNSPDGLMLHDLYNAQ
ncbi:hypothetical protein [Methylomonas rivi]|uniref:Uncharacterized protein n=1 Tax=Methylomonas rivi TaxID=2952226 RepID=A0ABT1U7D5_9GAMM|nr:hypothetical protein [Methylomonas sp. WSC-6]MCQ8129772.1 hypothetical protein [Methylomonas sp. WSC-6]